MSESIYRGGHPVQGFGLGEATTCPALPSGTCAVDLLRGDWSALPRVIGFTAARAALVSVGLLAVGEREHVVRNALGGALAIEGFVLAWAAWKLHQERTGVEGSPPPPAPSSTTMLTPVLTPVTPPGSSLVPQYPTKYTAEALQLTAMPEAGKPVMLCSYYPFLAADAVDLPTAQAQLAKLKTEHETPVESIYSLRGRRWIVRLRKRYFDPKTFKELPSDVIYQSSDLFPVPIAPDTGVPCG